MDIHPHSLVEIGTYILYVATTMAIERVGLAVVGESGPVLSMNRNEKQTVAWE